VTLTFIIGMRVFDQILGLTGGGPAVGQTETLGTQIYKQLFQFGRYGYGAAVSAVLAVIVLGLALMQLMFLGMNERRL
jgi:raffinose/stachyose/melibiose transport system permease protein